MIEDKIKQTVREVPDFPKPGIVFKDITPLLSDIELSKEIIMAMCKQVEGMKIDAIAGIESRGFIFGMPFAMELGVPFIPIRKKGKLPYKTIEETYNLEYGSATIEMHEDAVSLGANVFIHDDLLATGGTAKAAAKLIGSAGGTVAGFGFVIDLSFLNGGLELQKISPNILSLARY